MIDAERTQASRRRDATVFISYARDDDEKPPHDDTTHGWVKFFWAQLRWELIDQGVKQARLWMDRYEIDPAEAFTPAIEAAVKEAKLLIPIFSRNWTQSAWCQLEIDTFAAAHGDASRRIVPIYKSDLPPEKLPPVLQRENAKEGYRFFTRDESGVVRYFYWRGLQDKEAYFHLVRRIAEFVMGRLDLEVPPKEIAPAGAARTIFLAAATPELCDARQRLLNDLTSAGAVVVPAIDELPDAAGDYERAVRHALSRAELSVHLLGEDEGVVPREGVEPIVPLQLRMARELAATRSLPRLLWAPRWLSGRGDESRDSEKRDPFAVVGRYGGLQAGEEIHGEEVTDFSQWLRRRLFPPDNGAGQSRSAPPAALIVASADERDDELVADLANLLRGLGPRVIAVLAGKALPLAAADGAILIPWGEAPRTALDALLARVPSGVRIACLRLPAGDEKAKRTFFHEQVSLERVPALPRDRQEARQLLERLQIPLATAAAG